MSITTFAELKTAVANWLNRTDLTDRLQEFIALAETTMNYGDLDMGVRPLRTSDMMTAYGVNTVANTATVALPADFLEFLRLRITVSGGKRDLRIDSGRPLDADEYDQTAGVPSRATIVGSNLELGPKPDAVYAIDGTYYAKIPALSDSQTTNWLLTKSPNAYLYGALMHALPYLGADARAASLSVMFRSAVNQLTYADSRKRFANSQMASATYS